MNLFESQYIKLIEEILKNGQKRQTRNEETISLFAKVIKFDDLIYDRLPILVGRKYPFKGVIGEFAAFLKGPKNIQDFKSMDCNYWDKWGDESGNLNISYGNLWIDWNGVNQLKEIVKSIKNNPAGRRHLISGWDPSVIKELSLPCCHYSYQWYVNDDRLEMIWNQRSADVMLGLPADALVASIWNILMAKETGYKPGAITLVLGDTHIYTPHLEGVYQYLNQSIDINYERETYSYNIDKEATFDNFIPLYFQIISYMVHKRDSIKMELFE